MLFQKNFNIVKGLPFFVALVFIFASCQKEAIDEIAPELSNTTDNVEAKKTIADYPDKITIDNWKEFVHAPQEVIDYHQQLELEARQHIQAATNDKGNQAASRSSTISGYVRAYDGSWSGLPNVQVSIGGTACSTTSSSSGGNNYSLQTQGCSGSLCMLNHPASAINGVTTLDLVLTERHILGITPFTRAQQFIAADVTRNGTISSADITQLRNLILGVTNNWVSSQIIVYLPRRSYLLAQSQVDNTGTISSGNLRGYGSLSPCRPNSSSNYKRYAIKTGDVNGTFSF